METKQVKIKFTCDAPGCIATHTWDVPEGTSSSNPYVINLPPGWVEDDKDASKSYCPEHRKDGHNKYKIKELAETRLRDIECSWMTRAPEILLNVIEQVVRLDKQVAELLNAFDEPNRETKS